MGYYEDLRDVVHFALKKLHDDQGLSIEEIYNLLEVTSKETIRKLINKKYKSWNPSLQNLEDLRRKLGIQVPDSGYRMNLPADVKIDLNTIAEYFVRFDEYQRDAVLEFCRFADTMRSRYQNPEKIGRGSSRPYHFQAVAETAAFYDAAYDGLPSSEMSGSGEERQSDSSSRKTE